MPEIHARGRRVRIGLLLLGVVAPLLELWVVVLVAGQIGVGSTLLLLLAGVVVGFLVISRQGRKAWRAAGAALGSGRMPHRELSDGMLLVLAGVLFALPGFIGDVVALALLLPPVRALVRVPVAAMVTRRAAGLRGGLSDSSGPGPRAPNDGHPGPDVVQGDVVD